MLEKNVNKKILNYLRKNPKTVVQRIEDKYSAGVPDMVVCMSGSTFFVETKSWRLPARDSSKLPITPSTYKQAVWGKNLADAGGHLFFVCYTEALDKPWWILSPEFLLVDNTPTRQDLLAVNTNFADIDTVFKHIKGHFGGKENK